MHELPEDWMSVRLRDTGTWLSGGTPSTDEPRFWGGDLPWISAASLKEFDIHDSDRRLTKSGSLAGTRLVPDGSVLFVVRGMSLKKEFRVGVTRKRVAFGQDCKAIVPRPGIDARFLALAMKVRTREILSMVDEAGHGTGRLPTDLIAKLEVGIPPFPEQRQIVEVLDSVDARFHLEGQTVAKLRALQEGVVEALLASLVADTLPLGEHLALPPKNGFSPQEADEWTGLQALGLGCLTPNGFQARQLKNVPVLDGRNSGALLADGDLLMSRANTRDLVGLAGVYRDVGTPCIYPDLMMRLVVGRGCRSEYLELVLRSANVRRQIQAYSQGTSESMVKISGSSVRRLLVAIPHLVEQDRILAVVEATKNEIESHLKEQHKLYLLKQGLMEDLLFGRVRTAAAEAVR
ncbi:restriction endonuclease S subunit [Micromonospora luteifusca]|uniref:Restriction endonuclease S subunit n=1 Tax=Micromonospora luteifusca TaxID=709860 RepID=A0ABS2LS84_9ACTN|nr:restriction endonuclease subunit S [Micromonospora luteifusca]MBM7490992.1 restriction endonuclease S subunit [Micromonospora luteifusca]